MDAPKILKNISPSICPFCKKQIYVNFQSMIPFMSEVIGIDEVMEAKKVIREKIEEIEFKDPASKEEIIKWLDDKGILISMADTTEVLKQIVADNSPIEKKEE